MALNPTKKKELTVEMDKRKYFETSERVRAHVQEKNRFRNLTRYLNIQRREQEDDNRIQNTKADAAFREKEIDRENNLARELSKIKRDETNEMCYRQQLRENTPELRDLERQLKAAYIRKGLAAQISQKEAEKLNEKIQDKRTYEILRQAWVEEKELKRKVKQEDIYKKAQYKQELQDQMILREKSKRYEYEEFLKEKKMLDDIIQRIHDEDEREVAEKMIRLRKTQEEMMAFKEAQGIWKKRKQEEIEEENRKIQEFLMSKSADVKARLEEKERQEAIKAQISENIARQIFAERAKKKERDDIVQELLELENKEVIEKRNRQDLEKQIRQRIDTRESLDKQVMEQEERLRQVALEDAQYKDQMLAKLAEDNKVEQLSQQKKRMKMLQLGRDVQQMITDRRQKQAEQMQLQIKLKEREEYEMEQRRRIIEEERVRMLKEHVKNLVGYLPKGILTPGDLPHLGDDVLNQVFQNGDQEQNCQECLK